MNKINKIKFLFNLYSTNIAFLGASVSLGYVTYEFYKIYDDMVTVKTTMKEMPDHHKIVFHHEIYNEQDQLLNTGEITLYFMNAGTMERCAMPEAMKEKLEKYF